MDDKTFKGVDEKLTTFGDLRHFYNGYVQSNKSKASEFYNVINEPLLPFPDSLPVLLGEPLCELHMLLRSFNYTWKKMGAECSSLLNSTEDLAMKFAKSLNVVPESYQGQDFVGDKGSLMKLVISNFSLIFVELNHVNICSGEKYHFGIRSCKSE